MGSLAFIVGTGVLSFGSVMIGNGNVVAGSILVGLGLGYYKLTDLKLREVDDGE